MSEHDTPGETSDEALPLVRLKEDPRAADDNFDGALTPTLPSVGSADFADGSETVAIHFPLVQMHQLAHAIEHGTDVEVRRIHNTFLTVFSDARRNFFHFLQSLNIQVEATPTVAYIVDTNGKVLPIADLVTEIADSPSNGGFLGLTANRDQTESPIFSLTKVKSGAESVDIPITWDLEEFEKLSLKIAELDELAGLEELGTGDEITARKLPPVEPITETHVTAADDDLPDFTEYAELLPTTPPPGAVFTITPAYSTYYDQSTPRRDTRVLVNLTAELTPTPTREAPKWVWNLFAMTKDRGGLQFLSKDDLLSLDSDMPKSAE
jgi:hypothetical protein